jgi:hypothetical protein
MRISTSIDLLMHLAGQEAIAGQFSEVQPEHFYLALLRFGELGPEDLGKAGLVSDAARDLAAEVDTVRHEFQGRAIDSTQTRRQLRERLGPGGRPYEGGQMHRSPASRELFEAAGRLADEARSEVLSAPYLLQALWARPTPVLAEFLRQAPAGRAPTPTPAPVSTPLLDQYGHDLVRAAVGGVWPASGDRETEARSLGLTLSRADCRLVFLISDDPPAVATVVAGLAHLVAEGKGPIPRSRRLIDLTNILGREEGSKGPRKLLQNVLAEASPQRELILVFPAWPGEEQGRLLLDELKAALSLGQYQVICGVRAAFYRNDLAKDSYWKHQGQGVWIGPPPRGNLPDEL